MSRVGRQPIKIPEGVQVSVEDARVKVSGPRGTLERAVHPSVEVRAEGGMVYVNRRDDSRQSRGLHGLTRQLIANMIAGVSRGFKRQLEVSGVGYRAEARGGALYLTLGYSHPILFQLPPGVEARVDRQVVITLEAADRELLGQTAAALRRLRPPEPYKGKGIRYAGEHIRRKAGKAASTGGG